jgi:hypothetical protein
MGTRPLMVLVTLMSLSLAEPSTALARETLLTRALSCKIDDSAVGKLMDALAAEDAGMKSPAQAFAAPSGALYRLKAPIGAFGYSTDAIYVSPGRIVMVVSGQALDSVSTRLQLTPDPYGPAERPIDGAHKIIAYQLHQDALAGKVLVGCEYGDPAALAWLADDTA